MLEIAWTTADYYMTEFGGFCSWVILILDKLTLNLLDVKFITS
jgi:hypothetical protein